MCSCTLNSRDGIDVVSSGKIVSGDHKSLWHPHPLQQEVTISTAYFNLSSVFIHVMYWLCLICPISHFTSTSQEVPVPLLVSYVMGAMPPVKNSKIYELLGTFHNLAFS